jgi:hypothetical protein
MAGQFVVFANYPNQQILPHRPNCSFQSLYRPYIPDNVESWKPPLTIREFVLSFNMNLLRPRILYP